MGKRGEVEMRVRGAILRCLSTWALGLLFVRLLVGSFPGLPDIAQSMARAGLSL